MTMSKQAQTVDEPGNAAGIGRIVLRYNRPDLTGPVQHSDRHEAHTTQGRRCASGCTTRPAGRVHMRGPDQYASTSDPSSHRRVGYSSVGWVNLQGQMSGFATYLGEVVPALPCLQRDRISCVSSVPCSRPRIYAEHPRGRYIGTFHRYDASRILYLIGSN